MVGVAREDDKLARLGYVLAVRIVEAELILGDRKCHGLRFACLKMYLFKGDKRLYGAHRACNDVSDVKLYRFLCGIVSAVLGVAQSAFGPVGIVATLGACIAYLFALGLFASRRSSLVK